VSRHPPPALDGGWVINLVRPPREKEGRKDYAITLWNVPNRWIVQLQTHALKFEEWGEARERRRELGH